jgi:hypothetical protein
MSRWGPVAALLLVAPVAAAAPPPPVIDMHMHAAAADSQGPPPLGMCTPIDPFPAWDPRTPYGEIFHAFFKKPPCPDPVWSPMTDDEVMKETLGVAERWNVFGVVSGPPELVDAWLSYAPSRLIPALTLGFAGTGPPAPDAVRARHAAGKLRVLGEITNQYAGLPPDSPRLAPY